MNKVVLILIIILLIVQILFLDFDNIFDFAANKQTYINLIVLILLLIGNQMGKKK